MGGDYNMKFYQDLSGEIHLGDALEVLKTLHDGVVDCIITSPPYFGLRDYGIEGQVGLEEKPEDYTRKLVEIFREAKRVLKKDGTLWLNLGDSYATSHDHGATDEEKGWKSGAMGGERQKHHGRANGGDLPSKNLMGIPWRVAFALQADGWYLRQDIIWSKPNPMPESVTDRCTKAHEYIFLMAKSQKYHFDNEAIKLPVKQDWGTRDRTNGKYHTEGTGLQPHSGLEKSYEMANRRSVWTINTKPYADAHFATFPEELVKPMILAGCPRGGVVLDPFFGSGTTGRVAKDLACRYIGIELNPKYIQLAKERLAQEVLNF